MKGLTVEDGARGRGSKSNGSKIVGKANGSKSSGNKTIGTSANGAKARPDAHVLLNALIAFKRGDFSVRMPVDQMGLEGKVADALNDILDINQKMVSEFERISRVVG